MGLLLFILLCSPLGEVYCQRFPYVSFMGQSLANHSYVDLSLVGDDNNFHGGFNNVQCHTDLETCCSGRQGIHRGDWYFPNETRLPLSGGGDIFEARGVQRIDLLRTNRANSPTGIYRCEIPTLTLYNDTDSSVRHRVYLGLYTGNEGSYVILYLNCGVRMLLR